MVLIGSYEVPTSVTEDKERIHQYQTRVISVLFRWLQRYIHYVNASLRNLVEDFCFKVLMESEIFQTHAQRIIRLFSKV